MPTPSLLRLLFTLFVFVGGARAYRRLINSRAAGATSEALHTWSQEPLSAWRYEPYAATAVLVHILAISFLSALALGAASNPSPFAYPPIAGDPTMVALLWIAEGGSIALVGYLLGTVVAYPLASFRRSSILMAVTTQGLVHGRLLLPWRWFSHYSIDPDEGLLKLYSAFAPDLPSLISKPTGKALLLAVAETLREYLPTQRTTGSRAWYRTKYLFVPTMTLLCLASAMAAWWATRLPREVALFALAALASTLTLVGGTVVTLFGFGVLRLEVDKPRETIAA